MRGKTKKDSEATHVHDSRRRRRSLLINLRLKTDLSDKMKLKQTNRLIKAKTNKQIWFGLVLFTSLISPSFIGSLMDVFN
jgi:hypothetical protein